MIKHHLGLGGGFDVLRGIAQTVQFEYPPVTQVGNFAAKLSDDFRVECKKFILYRTHRIRERQWCSIQRLRALLSMIVDAESHA